MGEPSQEQAVERLMGRAPTFDRLVIEHTRSKAEARLFGTSTPARIGRYELLDTVARGGMGVVFRAYDPQLQRNVALKILHHQHATDIRSQQRMLTEARALAKLDHPNIVKIHDVLPESDGFVVVMELLTGRTLEDWQRDRRRSWREITRVYAQAAEALAAAHSVGVVHRDFKPSNAIVTDTGHVHVIDFGLARLDPTVREPSSTANPEIRNDELTTANELVGTFAYTSPEQLEGTTVSAASDQFSFCVSLHLALEGVHPFKGTTRDSRLDCIRRREVTHSATKAAVPPWLRDLVMRGLSPETTDRYASMSVVAQQLQRARGWRRWGIPVVMLVMLVTGVAIAMSIVPRPSAELCDGDGPLAETAWNESSKANVQRVLDGLGTPYAAATRARLIETIDGYTQTWRTSHRSVCTMHQQGVTSTGVLDKQMICLSRRLDDLKAAVSVLETTNAATLPEVMTVATSIPSAKTCVDLEAVQADVPPPDTDELREHVRQLRSMIGVAEAEAHAGRVEDALRRLASLDDAIRDVPYKPVQVEKLLAEGRIQLSQRDMKRALSTLKEARTLAFEQQMMPAALEASARLLYVENQVEPHPEIVENEAAVLIPLAAALRGDHFVYPLLLNNIGTVYLAGGDRRQAALYFDKAKDAIRRHDPGRLELTIVDLNTAMITSDAPTREALLLSLWQRLQSSLGPQHHSTLDTLFTYALYVDDPARALELLAQTLHDYQQFHPGSGMLIGYVASKQALVSSELGDAAATRAFYHNAIKLLTPLAGDDPARWRHLCEGELAVVERRPADAVAALQQVIDKYLHSKNWWEKADALRAEVALGMAEAAAGQRMKAIAHLQHATQTYPEILSVNEEVEYRRITAWARHGLATLQNDSGAAKLEREAQAFYDKASHGVRRALPF